LLNNNILQFNQFERPKVTPFAFLPFILAGAETVLPSAAGNIENALLSLGFFKTDLRFLATSGTILPNCSVLAFSCSLLRAGVSVWLWRGFILSCSFYTKDSPPLADGVF